jgi:hypothetical protein
MRRFKTLWFSMVVLSIGLVNVGYGSLFRDLGLNEAICHEANRVGFPFRSYAQHTVVQMCSAASDLVAPPDPNGGPLTERLRPVAPLIALGDGVYRRYVSDIDDVGIEMARANYQSRLNSLRSFAQTLLATAPESLGETRPISPDFLNVYPQVPQAIGGSVRPAVFAALTVVPYHLFISEGGELSGPGVSKELVDYGIPKGMCESVRSMLDDETDIAMLEVQWHYCERMQQLLDYAHESHLQKRQEEVNLRLMHLHVQMMASSVKWLEAQKMDADKHLPLRVHAENNHLNRLRGIRISLERYLNEVLGTPAESLPFLAPLNIYQQVAGGCPERIKEQSRRPKRKPGDDL